MHIYASADLHFLHFSQPCAKSEYYYLLFFFNDTATTEIYTLSLHDALPISIEQLQDAIRTVGETTQDLLRITALTDRKSTRLNSSHANISYAVFCLKKKRNHKHHHHSQTDTHCSRKTYHSST